jgi:hypothetical protein
MRINHVERMQRNTLPKLTLYYKPTGKRNTVEVIPEIDRKIGSSMRVDVTGFISLKPN